MAKAPKAKDLRKSIKRRRHYADCLRADATRIKAAAQASGSDDDRIFAERLADMAMNELVAARDEEAAAVEIESKSKFSSLSSISPFAGHSSAEAQEKSRRAIEAVRGRLAVDRIQYLLDHYKIEREGSPHLDMKAIENRLELAAIARPTGKPRMLLGKRIELAETTLFGKPRF